MQVSAISPYVFKSLQVSNSNRVEISNPFLYTTDSNPKTKQFGHKSFNLLIASLALFAVAATLIRLRSRNIVPENIVEIANENLGLNKLPYPKTAKFLKEKLLYPLKAAMEGDEKFIYGEHLKSGLILTSKNATAAKETVNALCEHAKELGILCHEIPSDLRRNGKIKWVYKTIEQAKKHHRTSNGDYVLINIGDISNLADLKIAKLKNTKVEEKLRSINKQTYPGVVWVGWTNATDSIPYFYNNAPILITKVLD